jgi:hypothetical protein
VSSTSITAITLSKSLHALVSTSEALKTFLRQDCFNNLSTLVLSRVKLSLEDISYLRLLPLATLDLAACGITTFHLLHLATHAPTLERLNICSNPGVDDDARVPLSALTKLKSLSFRDTSITLPCIRLLVYRVPSECRFMTVPSSILEYLNSNRRRYSTRIPDFYASDPRQIPDMTVEVLKKNLELHKKVNRDIVVTGSKAEMVARLTSILCNRIADEKVAGRIGRG